MFAPGVPQVMKEFDSNNIYLASFVVSIYLLGYSFGPLILAPLSEMYGRYPIYNACNVLYVVFNVACALAPNMSGLIVFRLLAGIAGSCPLTLGAGSISDMIHRENRGAALAAWALGPLLGPVAGPVGQLPPFYSYSPVCVLTNVIAGGYLTQAKGWRWTFWVLALAVSRLTLLPYHRLFYSYSCLSCHSYYTKDDNFRVGYAQL